MAKKETTHVKLHPTLEDLVGLQFKARGFSFLPKQPLTSLLAGRYASRLRGRGLTFEELRGYRAGDDIRSIDWKATARLRSTHVRVYSEERERPVLFVVDQRSGMFFGSRRTTKATLATEAAALGAWRVLDAKDRVGALVFGDDEIVQIRPQRSRRTVLHFCSEMVRLNRMLSADSGKMDGETLNEALRRAVTMATHDFLVVLVTDYGGFDEETRRLVSSISAHNDVLAVLTYDPMGISLPREDGLEVTDGAKTRSVPTAERFQADYEGLFQDRIAAIRKTLGSLRIPILPLCTHDPVGVQLRTALGR